MHVLAWKLLSPYWDLSDEVLCRMELSFIR